MEDVRVRDGGGGDGGEGADGGAEVLGDEVGGDSGVEGGAGAAEVTGRFDQGFVVSAIGHEGLSGGSHTGFDERYEALAEDFEA